MFNTSPAAVPQFQKQGGLVALDDFEGGKDYVEERSGDSADQYQSPDGKYYQIPWKQNPVMIFYNKDLFKKAGIDPENPPLATYDEFLADQQEDRRQRAPPRPRSRPRRRASSSSPGSTSTRCTPPQSGGKQTIEDGKATFDDAAGKDVWNFWAQMYKDGYAPKEKYDGDSFADKKAAMAVVGPWAIAVYKGKVNWGVVPVPTKDGKDPAEVHTFTDAKNIGLYSACKNQKTAWEVLKFATSEEQDGKLLETTGQMPIRTDLPDDVRRLLRQEPGLQDLRRPGLAHRRGAQRAQLGGDLAGDPRQLLVVGDLRQDARSTRRITAAADKADELAGQSDRIARDPQCSGPRGASAASPWASLFAAPYAVFLVVVFAYPLGLAVWISFHDYFFAAPGAQVERPFVGLANYRDGPGGPGRAARRSSTSRIFLVINVPLTVVLSLVLATALNSVTRFAHLPAGVLLRALRDGERRAGRRCGCSCSAAAAWSTRSSGRWRPTRRGWSTPGWRCR